jgi:hypothetical protein
MRLNEFRALPQDLTLGQCHMSRFDELYAGKACQVSKRFLGTGFLLAWQVEGETPQSIVLDNEAHALRCALFLAEHGVLPVSARRSRKPTLRGMQAVRVEECY